MTEKTQNLLLTFFVLVMVVTAGLTIYNEFSRDKKIDNLNACHIKKESGIYHCINGILIFERAYLDGVSLANTTLKCECVGKFHINVLSEEADTNIDKENK